MTISRQIWRAGFVDGTNKHFTQYTDCFGWIIQQNIMPIGSSLVVVSRTTVERSKTPNLTFYVGGRATVTNDLSGTYPDRVAGMFNGNRPNHPAGTTKITAIEELEFWCFNWLLNKRSLPTVSTFVLQPNETVTPNIGQRIFICKGELGNYFAADKFISDGTILTAACTTYGFYVENERV